MRGRNTFARLTAAGLLAVPLVADTSPAGASSGGYWGCPTKYGCGFIHKSDNRPAENNWNVSYVGSGCVSSFYSQAGNAPSPPTAIGSVATQYWSYGPYGGSYTIPSAGQISDACGGSYASPRIIHFGASNPKKVGIGVYMNISGSVTQRCAGGNNCGGSTQTYPFNIGTTVS